MCGRCCNYCDCNHFGRSRKGFSAMTPPTWNDLDKTRNISEERQWSIKQKRWRKSTQGFHRSAQNVFWGRDKNTTRPFGHLSCTHFTHFRYNRLESVFRWWPREKYKFLHKTFCRPHICIFVFDLGRALVRSVQLKVTISGHESHFMGY